MHRRRCRLVAAVALTAAAGVAVPVAGPAAPAAAATCGSGGGVTVIVDFRELGGGVQGQCVRDGGGQRASSLFPTAGFPLTDVRTENGFFVCRVSGAPDASREDCVDTPPADAYWGLWWSTGDGDWSYSNYGANGLKVPDGAWVGFSWKQGSGEAQEPGVTPRTPSAPPSPSPSPQPSATPSPQQPPSQPAAPSGGQGTGEQQGRGGPGGSASPEPGVPPSASPAASGAPTTPSAPGQEGSAGPGKPSGTSTAGPGAPSSSPGDTEAPDSDPTVADPAPPRAVDDGGAEGLPGWVPPLAVGGVLAGAAAALLLRRRLGTGSGS